MPSGLRHIATEPASLSGRYFSMDKKRSPQPRSKTKSVAGAGSDSEMSVESNSLSAESNNDLVPKTPPKDKETVVMVNKRTARRGSEWEILEGLKEGQRYEKKPDMFTGYLHKKRKWPLKGWHKRYFVLDKGLLIYAKSPGDIARGKIHGSLDIGLSVISTKEKRRRLDIDAEEFIYHLKAKTLETFTKWVEQLKHHRLYRQHILTFGNRDAASICAQRATRGEDSPSALHGKIPLTPPDLTPSRDGSLPRTKPCASLGASGGGGRLAAWVADSSPALDSLARELGQASQNLQQLGRILEQIEALPSAEVETCSFSGLSLSPPPAVLSCSNPSLPAARPQSLPNSDHLPVCTLDARLSSTPDNQLREDYAILAKDVHNSLKQTMQALSTERDRLKTALESDASAAPSVGPASGAVTAVLRGSLAHALQQNADLKARLARIHDTADLSDLSSVGPASEVMQKPLHASLSYSSSCLSASEFFDAEEYQDLERGNAREGHSETSSEAGSLTSEEGSVSSENSEVGTEYTPAQSSVVCAGGSMKCMTGRRTKLPVPRPDTEGLSLWNLLCKNIGKDLSQVSMPVTLNEPLNMLQRMCEELEYSELLDKAAELDDPYERMVYVAAFAVSSYSSSYFRAGSKPFNPLLGETYECIREDMGFRFVAEQVSHHPPVSVCYAESRNFVFWQDVRIKTKFWGKSMEFQPTGTVNVRLPKHGDQYQWNKVTTCVHNLFAGQRWVDQYGELKITSSSNISCKLTFVKASYWSAKRHEVFGVVTNSEGRAVRNLFGKWSEALYCGVAPSARCIWRQGTMPEEYELYYGFTRFAMELNELDEDMSKYLPITDTRFRPDQRMLEEGNLVGAENMKLYLEQAQRDRRKRKEQESSQHQPLWFSKRTTGSGEEVWEYTHKYWECRKNPGFVNMQLEALW
ncbi:oxysterol-binding protein-related protein 6-like isoform X2 [Bacillus rossius redtenbacheri]|uniref:oxysterol-binding protein-related protein 6-like isoform X2 n=1 Tax=Bacillus rossius redtenbacheri TaxID=93214 RepID=UPI002FDD6A52